MQAVTALILFKPKQVLSLYIMKAEKANTGKAVSVKQTAGNKVNPFNKLIDDKNRIVEAIKEGRDLSTLKGIKFVRPI